MRRAQNSGRGNSHAGKLVGGIEDEEFGVVRRVAHKDGRFARREREELLIGHFLKSMAGGIGGYVRRQPIGGIDFSYETRSAVHDHARSQRPRDDDFQEFRRGFFAGFNRRARLLLLRPEKARGQQDRGQNSAVPAVKLFLATGLPQGAFEQAGAKISRQVLGENFIQ